MTKIFVQKNNAIYRAIFRRSLVALQRLQRKSNLANLERIETHVLAEEYAKRRRREGRKGAQGIQIADTVSFERWGQVVDPRD